MKKGYTATKRKASENRTSSPSGFTELIVDKLEQLAREGAERMLAEMLEMEVSEFLQRVRYQRNPTFRGHRNGYAPERTVGVGLGAVKMQMPRVSHVPREVAADGFQSQIVSRYQRISRTTQRLLAQLYLEGLSIGDFPDSSGPRFSGRAGLPCPAGGKRSTVPEQRRSTEAGVADGI